MQKDFSQILQDLVVKQASRLINLDLYNKAILSTLPVALFATDEKGKIQTINSAAEEIFKVEAEKIKGDLIVNLLQSSKDLVEKAEQTLETGDSFHVGSKKLILDTGKEIVGNFSLQPLKDEEKVIRGILLTVEDLTYVHFLQDAFKHYVPPSVSDMISKDPKDLKLGGEEKELTVLFSDLIGFSAISEKYSPGEMVTILSDYFDEMTDQVFLYEGTLSEYVGDELLAIFGAPVDQPDNASRACYSALAMDRCLKKLNKTWVKIGRPALKARIGVNTGRMLVGNLGSRHRFSYGVVGDNVNLGSRLEGLCGIYGVDILVSEATANQVKESFNLREIDQVKVKGRVQPVKIFELISEKEDPLQPGRKESISSYEKGLIAYQNQNFATAIDLFKQALDAWSLDNPAKIMIERCEGYTDNPPPEDWDGVFEHQTKK
jgi:PAS domain S-box-containing protein